MGMIAARFRLPLKDAAGPGGGFNPRLCDQDSIPMRTSVRF
ncbi:MAG: hypothetical protein RBR09_00460 [Desulfobulbaceae bacterium]|nr:hypothetical protein [Desulfobulbaceae bacterium]MDY0349702.1 hypothetical protein [Desulfobulbaceae bacterium]